MAIIGGIAAANTGNIKDCYAIWNKTDNNTARPLVAKNSGTLFSSLLVYKGKCDGVFDDKGVFHKDYQITKTSDLKNVGFDTHKCWEYVGKEALLQFDADHWHGILKDNEKRPFLHIKTVEQYIAFAEKVNNGDERFLNAKVFLDCDLNFKGKSIPIIGKKREMAFAGIFDGQDHIIWNGVIQDNEAVYSGMFGYLKGKVANVIFDGRVIGTNNLGGLCGYNLGEISYCGAVVRVGWKDDRCSVGGIVANNEGAIIRCYSIFEQKRTVSPILLIIAAALVFLCIGGVGYLTILTAMDTGKEYATIEVDPGQEKVKEEKNVEKNGSNSVSFTFNKNVVISKSNGACILDFVNPSSDSNKIVIELQIVNRAGERVTIATSKAILPGYKLEALQLSDSAYDVLTGTETKGYVVLVPYDSKTEAKALVQTELPVSIAFE